MGSIGLQLVVGAAPAERWLQALGEAAYALVFGYTIVAVGLVVLVVIAVVVAVGRHRRERRQGSGE